MKKYLLVLPLAAALAACGVKHDVAYYKAHADEREAKATECRGKAGAFDNDKECISAALADDVRPVSYWKDSPDERKAKLTECKEHAATIGKSENCENASRAAAAAMGGGTPVYVPVGK